MPSGNGLVAAGPSSVLSTPSRDRDRERDRLPFPQSANPSPGPRHPATSSASSSFTNLPSTAGASLTASQQSVTADGLLKQYASATDPKLAALEQAVNDRNVLSAQNAQLWKLIERQRAGYNQILKEHERIRSEREQYKMKLAALTGSANGSSEKQHKSSERGQSRERTTRPSLDTVSSQSGSSAADHFVFNPRQTMTRHLSDDAPTPKSSQHPPNLHSTRSYEPLASRFHDTPPPSSANYPSSSNLKSDIPSAPPTSAPSYMHTPPPALSSRTPRPSPSPLVVPPRGESLPTPTSALSASSEASPYSRQIDLSSNSNSSDAMYANRGAMYPRKSSITESVHSVATSISGSVSSTAASSSVNLHNYSMAHTPSTMASSAQTSVDQFSRQRTPTTATMHIPPQIVTSSPITPSAPPASAPVQSQMLSTVLESRKNLLSRDSRISLPDEAKHYIANMVDSPVPSPKVDAFAARARAHASLTTPLTSNAGGRSSREGEFLDMEEDDDDGDEDVVEEAISSNTVATGNYDEDDPRGADSAYYNRDVPDQRSENEALDANLTAAEASQTSPNGEETSKKMATPYTSSEDFPYSPSEDTLLNEQSSGSLQEGLNDQQPQVTAAQTPPSKYSHHDRQDASVVAFSHAGSAELTSLPLENPYSPSNQPTLEQQFQGLQQPPMPAFRALPLLSSDLPYTTISVSHSFVRPNDRGKEVLSFIVTVNPGHGKDGWKVEKMYSDVLSLDQRVRSSVGKGVGKKITNLPEGKLWKDHAPAKVDQRKAVLELYLQSLINLPVKNNDEVIAFFTSDIVRETKQPVMQAGYKEGYLTKRGKNFGGWKTRYFVLSGPVLEYYDCRGGAHLGSITITGAQIGRQQRTDRAPSTDEEKEYRHAFLIVEAKRGPGGNHPRHVLCAESDEDRDSWVEMLVRYFTGVYSEEPITYGSASHSSAIAQQTGTSAQPRASTSSSDALGSSRRPPIRGMSKDDISIAKGAAVPLSQLPPDASNAKLFQTTPLNVDSYARSSSPSKLDPSPVQRDASSSPLDAPNQRRILERGQGLPSSLPDSSPLSAVHPFQLETSALGQRANSELGHYPDLHSAGRNHRTDSPEKHRIRDQEGRKSFYPTSGPPLGATQSERVPSPEKLDANGKVKISGPLNGAPIPSGFKFGGKDASPEASTSESRREKAKSRSFWGFGKGDKQTAAHIPRAVFGVPLEEALEISQICNLPSIVFRSIQYLEAKKADQEEGIYRLSGSSAVIKSLKDRFNAEGDVDLLASDEYWDPHAIAGLLKSFLRELPASILTRELHLRFLAVIDFVDAQERIKELSQLIAALPIANYSLLRALTAHLILIVQNSGVNKMTMRNVGIVFSPTLGIPAGVFSLMLGEFNRVFNVETGEDVEDEREDDESSEPLRRNSRRYSEANADQFLGLTGRFLTTPAEETPSEGDDFSVHDESGTETTEGDPAAESPSTNAPSDAGHQERVMVTPATPLKNSRASHVAASRGLNVTVTHSERGNRHSKMIGLPSSPRPPHSPSRPSEGQDSLS